MSKPSTTILEPLLHESAARHQHLCPRQVLGIRMGLYGLRYLSLIDKQYQPRYTNQGKRLLTIAETDGCGADGIAVATHCYVGRRTLRVVDYGKMAATMIDTTNGRSIRLAPHPQARQLAQSIAPDAESRWHAYLTAYQHIPDEQLLTIQSVKLTTSIEAILSRPDARVHCQMCGEEIRNEREVVQNGRILCQSCAGSSYYQTTPMATID